MTFDGAKLNLRFPSYDFVALKEVWHRGVYEVLQSPSGVVCDVGAHVGTFALKCARSPRVSRVLAFEPEPENLGLLRANVVANRLSKVQVFPYALGSEPGRRRFYLSKSGTGHHSLAGARNGPSFEVDVRPLDEVIEEIESPEIGFVKVDVEGFELEVLRGASRTLARDHPALAIELDSDKSAIVNLLRELGYSRFSASPISPLVPTALVLYAKPA